MKSWTLASLGLGLCLGGYAAGCSNPTSPCTDPIQCGGVGGNYGTATSGTSGVTTGTHATTSVTSTTTGTHATTGTTSTTATTGTGTTGGVGGAGTTTATTGTTTGTGGAGGAGACMATGHQLACQMCCEMLDAAGATTFFDALEQECACNAGATCNAQCSGQGDICPNNLNGSPSNGCVSCINGLAMGDPCHAKTTADCQKDAGCVMFATCVQGQCAKLPM